NFDVLGPVVSRLRFCLYSGLPVAAEFRPKIEEGDDLEQASTDRRAKGPDGALSSRLSSSAADPDWL
ncbi:MAG: hypothetical protein AAGD08_18295, partial [Pseudomonadota bacterium]